MFDTQLFSYATPRQIEYMQAMEQHGSFRKAAKALGIHSRAIERGIAAVKHKAALQGYSPEHHMTKTAPDGFITRGVSSYFDADGNLKGQWVKTSVDRQKQEELMRAAYEGMSADLKRVAPIAKPQHCDAQLATQYTFTDSHVGMLAWGQETGADWDLEIAERTLVGCFEQMMKGSPEAKVGVICQLGDFLHQDSIEALTPTSGHLLDSDGRFPKVVTTAIRILRRIVDMALHKHEKVVVIMAEGNHDISSSIWLRVMFKALYENEPRVEVIDSPLPYYVYQHGKTMLAFHHGHLRKNDQLPLLFASQFPMVWGTTTKRYAHTGHRHHIEEKEHSGMLVVQHPTLASRDAYAARGGWISERQVRAISYHTEHGEVARTTIVPEMLAGVP